MKKKKGVRKTSIKQAGKKIESPAVVQNHTPYVVGIGASAGGLEALEKFFKNMPATSGLVFIVVTHLDPTHTSLLPELIQKTTQIKIHSAEEGMKLEPDNVYVAPPNKYIALINNTIGLVEMHDLHGARFPIDYFFKSLAADCCDKAISIILSGMGTDGTSGLKSVKNESGLVIVQNPATAKFNNMPLSSIATGLVDYVLSPEEMPKQLINYANKRIKDFKAKKPVIASKLPGSYQKLFMILRTQTGHDFSLYKPNTIHRRVEKRMTINQVENLTDYVQFLRNNPAEVKLLFKELLIGVTNFFRDPEAFDNLKKSILETLNKKLPNSQIRVWVPGCSTGEEAYSVAIILRECMEDLKFSFDVQIFATDIDNEAIEKARYGKFTGIDTEVSKTRLNRYFTKDGDIYQIRKEVREMLIFAQQDLIKDPPFTRLDLISCRNLLIYMNPELQKKMITLFHFSLVKDGLLFLGSSETISGYLDLFTLTDRKFKIYKRKDSMLSEQPLVSFPVYQTTIKQNENVIKPDVNKDIKSIVEKIVFDNYSSNYVLTNSKGEILYVHGKLGKYLELTDGQINMNVFEMARPGLRESLSALFRKVSARKKALRSEGVKIKQNRNFLITNLTIRPINRPEPIRGTFLIIFEERGLSPKETHIKKIQADKRSDKLIKELEHELKTTRENLRTTVEELETSNEELKSANEELQSTNEELQSLNEEIETSKEELQSLNEELITINSELQSKNDELSVANNDMKNLLDAIDVPTIFLDNDLCIKRFTKNAVKVINLISTDIGRPFSHMANKLKYDNIIEDVHEVLRTLYFKEIEVRTADNIWYQMRILPYRTINNVIDGVVITFLNINESKKESEEINKLNVALLESEKFANNIIESFNDGLIVLDQELKIISTNSTFYNVFNIPAGSLKGKFIREIFNNSLDVTKLKMLVDQLTPENNRSDSIEFEYMPADSENKKLLMTVNKIFHSKLATGLILLTIKDVITS